MKLQLQLVTGIPPFVEMQLDLATAVWTSRLCDLHLRRDDKELDN